MSSVLRKDLRTSTAEGMAASVMVGIGETYLPAFVLALSGSQLACGLVSTVPLVMGALLQLGSPWLMRKCGSYRRWVSLCALVQAATFVPLAAAAVAGYMPTLLVFALVAVYWATGLGGSGPWNAWMETLVPSRCGHATSPGGRGSANGALRWASWAAASPCNWPTGGEFRWRSSPCCFSRRRPAVSRPPRLLAGQCEPQSPRSGAPGPSLTAIFHSLTDGANGRLLLYLMAATAAVQIAGPYFNPYMLSGLQFSYSTYVIVVCASIVAKILFLPTVGRIADRVGVRRVFWVSAAAIVPSSALWLASSDCRYLIAVQIYSGMAWCAFDLATLLLFFETIPRQKRVERLDFLQLGYLRGHGRWVVDRRGHPGGMGGRSAGLFGPLRPVNDRAGGGDRSLGAHTGASGD